MNAALTMDIAGQARAVIHLQPSYHIVAEVSTALANGHLDLPTLPDMAHKFQCLTDDPDVSAEKVIELISSDPVVSMYIIRAANSAALSNGSPASNLRSAVSRLGYRMLRCMVVNITMTRLFQARSPLINRQLVKLWKHSREVAAGSYVLAQQQMHLKPEEAMLAGLVHDIGALPLYLYADRSHLRFDQTALEEMVRRFSADIGAKLLQSWNFPDELVAVAAEHEDMYRVKKSGVADYVDVVTMANLQMSDTAKNFAWKNILAAERLGYYAADCRDFLSNHEERLAAAKDMLGIGATRH